jgi:hypothetical protein
MEYDGLKMIFSQLDEYEIEDRYTEVIDKLKAALDRFDWDEMEELLKGLR